MCVGVYEFFFFQAEDGIRDLVRSRGLVDVYKRQGLRRLDKTMPLIEEFEHALAAFQVAGVGGEFEPLARARQGHVEHLSLIHI